MAVAISPEDFTIEARVESEGHRDSPKPSTPKSSRRSHRSKPGQKPASKSKPSTSGKTPSNAVTNPSSPKLPGSESQEATEVVDLGSLAMDIGKAIGDSLSASMCSSISQFTQDMIAVLKRAPPDMGGQNQQSPDQRDKQEDVPVSQAEVDQPSSVNRVSEDQKMLSSSCASKSRDRAKDKSTTGDGRKKKESPSVGSEPVSKRRRVTEIEPEIESTHADSDMSEAEENENDADSVNESDEWSPTQETDSFVELVFRKMLTKAQKDKLLKDYPKPSSDAAHVPVLDSSIRAAYYQMQPADSQLYRIQRSILDAANPLIKAFDLLQQEKEEVDVAEVSIAVKASLLLLGGANAHLTTERRKGALSKMKPQWAHLAKEKFPEAKRNLFGEGFEEVVERRAKAITALKKAATFGGPSTSQQNFRTSTHTSRPFRHGTTRNQSRGWLPKTDGVFGRLDGPPARGRGAPRYPGGRLNYNRRIRYNN